MSEYIIQGTTLLDIAEAIREKTGIAEAIQVSNISSIIRDELGISEDLSEVIAEQEQLIAELEALLEEKSTEGLDAAIAEQDALVTELETLLLEKSSVQLPTLDNPATGDQILAGYDSYDVDGLPIEGTIETKTSNDITVSGATVSVPAGYYASTTSKSVAITTQATPSISVDTSGKITASVTQTSGYVSDGTKSATHQMSIQAAKTVTPSTSEQTAVAANVYTTGVVKVAAMPTATQATPAIEVSSSGLITASATQSAGYVSAGTKSATKQLTVQAAKTVTPTTSDQIAVSSGVYTTGSVTVAGDVNLKAENIAEGISIFGVIGTLAAAVSSGGLQVMAGTVNVPALGSTTVSCSNAKYAFLGFHNNSLIIPYGGTETGNNGLLCTASLGDSGLFIESESPVQSTGSLTYYIFYSDPNESGDIIQGYYAGATEPDASIGADGDLYLRVVS